VDSLGREVGCGPADAGGWVDGIAELVDVCLR